MRGRFTLGFVTGVFFTCYIFGSMIQDGTLIDTTKEV